MSSPTDFNDMAALAGLKGVAAAVAAATPVDAPDWRDGPRAWPEMSSDDIAFYHDAPEPTQAPDTTSDAPWPEPTLPGVMVCPEVPCAVLPGVWGEFAQAVAANTQTPAAMSVLAALGVLATLLQGRFEVDLGSHREILAFWSVTVSPSGTRKSAVMSVFQEPLLYWEKLVRDRMRRDVARNEAVRSTIAKRIEALKQSSAKAHDEELKAIREQIENEELSIPDEIRIPTLFTEDSTPETMQRLIAENAGRMAVLSDEPGLFRILGGLYSKGGASLEVFLKGHVGSALKVERAARSIFVQKPCVSMGLMIQPDMVADLAGNKQFRASGLMARFFYAVPQSNIGRRNVRQRNLMPQHIVQAYESAVMGLLADYPPEPGTATKPVVLRLDALAEDLWLDFSQEIEDGLTDGGAFTDIGDWMKKLAGAVARISALFELAANGLAVTTVSLESMHQAIKLARLLIPHTRAAFGLLGADAVEDDAVAVLKWIQTNQVEEFSQRDLQRKLDYRFKTAAQVQKAIESLKLKGCVRTETKKNQGARPSTVIRVNPLALSGF
ncbi:hypothetical protein RA876_13650 [Rhodoferax antarcticus]|nr:hypothetical protein RA876_13650 [Rhodoferax antarcticus]